MRSIELNRAILILSLGLALLGRGMLGSEVGSTPQSGKEILALSSESYRKLPALKDTLTLTVELPASEPVERIIHYAVGESPRVSVEIEQQVGFIVEGERLLIYRVGVDRYVESPIEGNLGATLATLRSRMMAGFLEPPQVALRAGGGPERALEAFRITHYLEPLTMDGYRRLDDGRHEIHFTAANGECRFRWDPSSLLIESFDSRFHPAKSPEGYEVRLHGSFAPEPLESYLPASDFSTEGRMVVSGLADLGDPTPGITAPPESVLPTELLQRQLLDLDELAKELHDKRILLIGETHGHNETLAYASALLEKLDDRPVSLLLELPAATQPLLDRYMHDGDEETLVDLFFPTDVLQLQNLIRWAREHKRRIRRVLAIDEDSFKIGLQRNLGTDTRNRTMAGAVLREYKEHPDALVVAYCGQLHLTFAGRYRFDEPSREPVGSRLLQLGVPREDVANVMLDGAENFPLHVAWKEPGALRILGEVARIPFQYFIDYPIYGVKEAGELFDYFVNLGPLTDVEVMKRQE